VQAHEVQAAAGFCFHFRFILGLSFFFRFGHLWADLFAERCCSVATFLISDGKASLNREEGAATFFLCCFFSGAAEARFFPVFSDSFSFFLGSSSTPLFVRLESFNSSGSSTSTWIKGLATSYWGFLTCSDLLIGRRRGITVAQLGFSDGRFSRNRS